MRASIFLIAVTLFLNSTSQAAAAHPQRIVAYYPAWTEKASPLDLPADKLTNLIYAFLHVSTSGECELLPDIDEAPKALDDFAKLKKKFPRLKTTLAIGGANYSENFAKASKTDQSRQKLVTSCMEFVEKYAFDGVDIDWEYPATKVQFQDMAELAKAFRAALGNGRELSLAVPSGDDAAKYPVSDLAKVVDWFGLMAYDQCDETSKETCNHALYKAEKAYSVRLKESDDGDVAPTGEEAVKTYLSGGARKDQIVFGVPFYGYKWKVPALDSSDNHGIGQKVRAKGVEVSFREIKAKFLDHKGYEFAYDLRAQAPVIWNDDTNEVISFDNETSISFKRGQVMKQDLGGLMIWDITEDDDQNTLLNAVSGSATQRAR